MPISMVNVDSSAVRKVESREEKAWKMFLLKTLGTALFGANTDAQLLQLPSGRLHKLTRRTSATRTDVTRQMVFRDAQLTIRRTDVPFTYQLIATRVYEEGEDVDDDDEVLFVIDEQLLFARVGEEQVDMFAWVDPAASNPASTISFEFAADLDAVSQSMSAAFESLVYACMYERRNKRNHADITDKEMAAYVRFVQASAEAGIAQARDTTTTVAPSSSSTTTTMKIGKGGLVSHSAAPHSPSIATVTSVSTPGGFPTSSATPVQKKAVPASASNKVRDSNADAVSTPRSQLQQSPVPMSMGSTPLAVNSNLNQTATTGPDGESIVKVVADLYLYDSRVSQFNRMRENISAELIRTARFEFHLVISDASQAYISQPLESSMNAQFNAHASCFVWLWRQDDNADNVYPWSIKFHDVAGEVLFRDAFGACMYESLNKSEFLKVKAEDRKFLVEAYQEDVEMADAEDAEEEGRYRDRDDDEDDDDEDEEEEEEEDSGVSGSAPGDKSAKISSLVVGHKDRSYFVRGHSIGVLGHPDSNSLEYSTVINNVQSLSDKKSFTPSKVLLHDQDTSMLLMRPNDEHVVYRMDLNVGKVVEEWKIDDVTPVSEIIPEAKNSGMTPNRTLVGINHNSIFRIDPRLESKLVRSESKTYASNVGTFNCATTTGSGKLAIGSSKGDIRLYDKLSVRAKTHLPGLGDPILGIDTTENGTWVVATCKTYLLLIGTEAKDAKKDGATFSGFNKSLGDQKPVPKRLQLRPEHVAWMGGVVSFTAAKFNTSAGHDGFEETSIVTSTGPFVVTWNFKRARQGKLNDYTIKQYGNDVVADNFKFGEDRNIIVALPEDVHMVSKSMLQTPAKMLKSRSSIVNSPF
ncbi:VID27 cytoplasmic protein-domain-containing protein [Chytriomyces sp. MP71]|nr:VID27 cytoplasmic protein-domain-containing protein [Chytriomyces sp. MP71]